MRQSKKNRQNITYILILLVAICILFLWYSTTNSQRIENRNLNYALDSARQTAKRIEGEFANSLLRIQNYAYFLDVSLDEPDISTEMLKELEENTAFDSLRFTNADGVNLAPNGKTSNISDRDYFIRGMKGESGSASIFHSRMINDANYIGMILQVSLIGMFILYITVLVIRAQRERKKLEQENQEMGYVISGMGTLFSRFTLADLDEGTYHYLTGTKPERADFPTSGKYTDFITYLCSFMADKDDIRKFPELLKPEAIIAELGESATDTQYEYPIQRGDAIEWEHVNIICLERKNGQAGKVLFVRQDITKLKEKELRTQAEISLANRKERQYITATMSDAICTYEVNLTRNLIDQEIICQLNGMEFSLMERAGLHAPCSASEWFEGLKHFVDADSLEDYSKVVDVQHLLYCFSNGQREAVAEYWRR